MTVAMHRKGNPVIGVLQRLQALEVVNRSIMSAGCRGAEMPQDDKQVRALVSKAFDALVQTSGDDHTAIHPMYRETWQWMGDVIDGNGTRYHQFRHRHHPLFDRRVYVAIREIN